MKEELIPALGTVEIEAVLFDGETLEELPDEANWTKAERTWSSMVTR